MWIKVRTDSFYFKTELTNEEKGSEEENLRGGGGSQCNPVVFITTKGLHETEVTF